MRFLYRHLLDYFWVPLRCITTGQSVTLSIATTNATHLLDSDLARRCQAGHISAMGSFLTTCTCSSV